MDTVQTIVLALIQGITEFLPISSSAHLLLPAQLLGWPDQGLAFDVAVHLGSLLAVVMYFWRDLLQMAGAWLASLSRPITSEEQLDAQRVWMVMAASLPALLIGFFSADWIEQHLRSAVVIATTTTIFALLLAVAEYQSRRQQLAITLTWWIAIAIGISQVLALVPGVSRSGITITAAVLLGLSRSDAARFSFLLSIPVILAAGGYAALQLYLSPPLFSFWQLALAVLVSAMSAYACIALFLSLLERIGFMPFVWYRLLLGVVLFTQL